MTDMRATERLTKAMEGLGLASRSAAVALGTPAMRAAIAQVAECEKTELLLRSIGYHQVRAAGAVRDAVARSNASLDLTIEQALRQLYLAASANYPWDLPYLSEDGTSTTPPQRSWLLTEQDPLA